MTKQLIHTMLAADLNTLIGPHELALSWESKTRLINVKITQQGKTLALRYRSQTRNPWTRKNEFQISEDLKRTFR